MADFLTLHLPLTTETRVDRSDAREDARRRPVVTHQLPDEAALAALRPSAAALDVFSAEPYSGPLLKLDSVVVTPHLAASTEEAQDRAGLIVAEQVAAALDGGIVTNAVNIPVVDQADLEVLGPFIPLLPASAVWRWSWLAGG
jgi:phosphoglycerate dehydrogenase-like enzyme